MTSTDKNSSKTDDKNQNNKNQNNTDENQTNENDDKKSTVEDAVQQGYYQVEFDSNGAITFNSQTIETSFNSEDALLSMTDTTYDDFLKEGKDVLKDITKFLNGEVFDEIHPFYLDYNAITVEPKSASTSTPTEYDNDPQTPQDTKKSMKKTKANAAELQATIDRNKAIQANQNRWGNLSVNYSQTAGQTSVPIANIMAGKQKIEKQR